MGVLVSANDKAQRRRGDDIVWKAVDIPALAVSTGSAFDFL